MTKIEIDTHTHMEEERKKKLPFTLSTEKFTINDFSLSHHVTFVSPFMLIIWHGKICGQNLFWFLKFYPKLLNVHDDIARYFTKQTVYHTINLHLFLFFVSASRKWKLYAFLTGIFWIIKSVFKWISSCFLKQTKCNLLC